MNVNIVDREKAEKNVELKKKKPEYKPYDEDESVDDMVTVSSCFCFAGRISICQSFLKLKPNRAKTAMFTEA